MDIEKLKLAIEQRIGIPAAAIVGASDAEIFESAKLFLAENGEPGMEKANWLASVLGTEMPKGEVWANLLQMEQEVAAEGFYSTYPQVKDGGTVSDWKPTVTTRDQFAEWFNAL